MKEGKPITEAEKAGLLYKYYNGIKSYKIAFCIAFPQRVERIKEENLNVEVSKWKNSQRVQNYVKTLQTLDNARLENYARLKTKEMIQNPKTDTRGENGQERGSDQGGESGKGTLSDGWVNFQDISEFLNFCERQANIITDEKERQNYLKMISDLLRYKEQDTQEKEVQRFYTPLNCSQCPLYKKEK